MRRVWGLILALAVPFDLLRAGKNSWWIFASDLEVLLDIPAYRSIKRAWAGICWLLARVGRFLTLVRFWRRFVAFCEFFSCF